MSLLAGLEEKTSYASVDTVLKRFKLTDFYVEPGLATRMQHKNEQSFIHFLLPLLRTVNMTARNSQLVILARAKWFGFMKSQDRQNINGSQTSLGKPKKIVVNVVV